MTGFAFSRKNRRKPRYLACLADLAGLKPAEHLRPQTPAQTPYQPFQSKSDRHRAASEDFRRTGAP